MQHAFELSRSKLEIKVTMKAIHSLKRNLIQALLLTVCLVLGLSISARADRYYQIQIKSSKTLTDSLHLNNKFDIPESLFGNEAIDLPETQITAEANDERIHIPVAHLPVIKDQPQHDSFNDGAISYNRAANLEGFAHFQAFNRTLVRVKQIERRIKRKIRRVFKKRKKTFKKRQNIRFRNKEKY